MTDTEQFDLETVYDDEISPHMVEIIKICKRVGMPMFANFGYRLDKEGTLDQCTTALAFRGDPLDKVTDCIKVVKHNYDVIKAPDMVSVTVTNEGEEK